jgi:beta-glucosidase-like glycosyl hydrolase
LVERLYQLIISRLNGYDINSKKYRDKIYRLIEKGICGFIIFGGRRDEIKGFVQKIQSFSETPLFIASDVECGVGKQIYDATTFPCQMAIAAAIKKNDSEDVIFFRRTLKAIAQELIDIGINMPLIPVLDVNQNPENPIICTRAFSDNPEDVAWFGSWYIKELEKAGLISCAKHFPGHGDTDIDSHISLPVIAKSFEDIKKIDLIPFIKAIEEGVSSIMVGHLIIPSIDSKPASLSKKIITDLLRKELGFDGLVLTDALNMKALNNIKNISVECIKAGADILLHPEDVDKTFEELKLALGKNILTEEEVDKALNRIMKVKRNNKTLVMNKVKETEVNYQSHAELSAKLTEMSITIVKGASLLPISDETNFYLVLSGERSFFDSSPFKDFFKNVLTVSNSYSFLKGKEIKENMIFLIFTNISAGKGTSGIDDREKEQICRLIKKAKNSILISFGSPYVLRFFNDADVLIAAYEATEQAQRAVIKCLKGELGFKGRLPVKI